MSSRTYTYTEHGILKSPTGEVMDITNLSVDELLLILNFNQEFIETEAQRTLWRMDEVPGELQDIVIEEVKNFDCDTSVKIDFLEEHMGFPLPDASQFVFTVEIEAEFGFEVETWDIQQAINDSVNGINNIEVWAGG